MYRCRDVAVSRHACHKGAEIRSAAARGRPLGGRPLTARHLSTMDAALHHSFLHNLTLLAGGGGVGGVGGGVAGGLYPQNMVMGSWCAPYDALQRPPAYDLPARTKYDTQPHTTIRLISSPLVIEERQVLDADTVLPTYLTSHSGSLWTTVCKVR